MYLQVEVAWQQGLRVTQEQLSGDTECLRERLQHALDRLRREIDQDVAAEYGVQPLQLAAHPLVAGGRQVQVVELHQLLDLVLDQETLADPVEVALQVAGRGGPHRPGGVHPVARLLERAVVDVRGEDPDVPVPPVGERLHQRDRYRVRFLAGGAPRGPDAYRLRRGGDLLGEALAERLEVAGVAEKVGLADGQELQQFLEFVTVFPVQLQVGEVLGVAVQVQGGHALVESARQGGAVARLEVQPGAGKDVFRDVTAEFVAQLLVGAALFGPAAKGGQIVEKPFHVEWFRYEIEDMQQLRLKPQTFRDDDDRHDASPGRAVQPVLDGKTGDLRPLHGDDDQIRFLPSYGAKSLFPLRNRACVVTRVDQEFAQISGERGVIADDEDVQGQWQLSSVWQLWRARRWPVGGADQVKNESIKHITFHNPLE